MSDWLPKLVLLDDVGGDWKAYIELVYSFFQNDFITHPQHFRSKRISLRKHPLTEGKEVTFWHLVSTGNVEEERIPDFRRCERIKWPKSIIENSEDESVYIWENTRKNDKNLLFYLHEERYLVVLGVRDGYFLLCTAYFVEQNQYT